MAVQVDPSAARRRAPGALQTACHPPSPGAHRRSMAEAERPPAPPPAAALDAIPYVDTLLKEYLAFRGFTATLAALQGDLVSS